MASKDFTRTIDTEISKVKEEISKLEFKLKALQDIKREREKDKIVDAYVKSGKSFDEVMSFLEPESKESTLVDYDVYEDYDSDSSAIGRGHSAHYDKYGNFVGDSWDD